MKKIKVGGLTVAACLLCAGGAVAQAPGGGAEEEKQQQGGLQLGQAAGAGQQLVEAHVVRGGDTLWDLCAKYLNSPWYWPKIWSYNPQISNPHWIYPGNELRFYPTDEALPTALDIAPVAVGDDAPAFQATGQITTNVLPGSVWQGHRGFIMSDDREMIGKIKHSDQEAYLLTDYDRVYIELQAGEQIELGDRLAVYHTGAELMHPKGGVLGRQMELIGALDVVKIGPRYATASLVSMFRPAVRGDRIARFPAHYGQRVSPVDSATEATGLIVGTFEHTLEIIGEHQSVYIDRGRSHGVQVGNTFAVIEKGDRFLETDQDLPYEEIGEVMVMDAREGVSTAIVVRSLRELKVGDELALRTSFENMPSF